MSVSARGLGRAYRIRKAYGPHHDRCPGTPEDAPTEEEVTAVGQKVNPHGFRLGISTDFTSLVR